MAGLTVEHFGELVRPGKSGHRLTRDMYAHVNKTSSTRVPREMYSDELWAAQSWAYEDEDPRAPRTMSAAATGSGPWRTST